MVKARTLSGESGLLFLRNSVTGAIEVRRREGRGVELNAACTPTECPLGHSGTATDRRLPRSSRWLLVVALGVGAFCWLRNRGRTDPVPGQQRCVATANGRSVVLDLDQAHYASIIVGLSVSRGLPPRAASIAMATVYQETGIRNLDYGDRDSVGLFQQRPSQGWGTEKQLMDPYYATGKFYDALVKIDSWETGDINDVAQRVQRSGYPEAYRDHEADARVLASTLTGHSPAGFSCLDRTGAAGDPDGLARSLRKTFGKVETSTDHRSGDRCLDHVKADNTRRPGRTRTTRWPTPSTTA